MTTLRDYQQAAVDATFDWLANRKGNPLVVVPTGGGKSVILSEIIIQAYRADPDVRIMVVTHVKELIEQNHAALLRMWPGAPAGVYSAGLRRRDERAQILFCGIQSVYDKTEAIGRFNVVIVDECFVGETEIETTRGTMRIDKVRPGDTVYCATGLGRVLATRSRQVAYTVKVEFADGTALECTHDHPFFTDRGWVKAQHLEGSVAYDLEAVRLLWEGVLSEEVDLDRRRGAVHPKENVGSADLLRAVLCQEARQPDEQEPGSPQDEGDLASHSSPTDQAGRERAIAAAAAASLAACPGRRVGVGSRGADRHGSVLGLPDLLQDRPRQQGNEGRDRDRRRVAHVDRTTRSGHQEDAIPGHRRVVRVSRVERGGPAVVFNLHVDRHPSYFAGGRLVHNCHLIPANGFGRYRTLFAALTKYNPNLRVVGLTATPFRTDSGRLDTGDERIFHGLAYVCEILPLIEAGYLSRITNIAGNAEIDTSNVAVRGGEYVESELQAAAMAGDNVAQAVEETIKRAAGRKSWLLFATGIEHAKAVAEELRKRGIETATIFGNTGHHERDAIVKGFRAGLVRCVVNVGVLTTGFDAPAVDLVVLLRPTYSPGLYVQMVGRGLRTAPGKKDCLILDFGGNVLRHGPINRVNIRQPKAKGDENQEEPATVKKCPECGLVVDRDATECECGYEFARGAAEHDATPEETLPILEPKRAPIERWKVGRTLYDSHCKPGKRPVLRVTHLCGFGQEVNEWVCLEHDAGSFPRKKAERWWVERGGPLPVPDTVDVALTILSVRPLPDVVEVVVLTTGEFPEVKGAKIDREDAGWRADAEDAGKPSTDVPDDDLPF